MSEGRARPECPAGTSFIMPSSKSSESGERAATKISSSSGRTTSRAVRGEVSTLSGQTYCARPECDPGTLGPQGHVKKFSMPDGDIDLLRLRSPPPRDLKTLCSGEYEVELESVEPLSFPFCRRVEREASGDEAQSHGVFTAPTARGPAGCARRAAAAPRPSGRRAHSGPGVPPARRAAPGTARMPRRPGNR
jgi:hypothetical protein